MGGAIRIVPCEARYLEGALKVYSEGFFPKFGFISPDPLLQAAFPGDFGVVEKDSVERDFVAVDGEQVVGFLSVRFRGQRTKGRVETELPVCRMRRKYGVRGILRAMLLGLVFGHRPARGEIFIDSVCVSPEARGMGVGSSLLDHAEMLALEKGLTRLSLFVMLENPRAKDLYERKGFRTTGFHRLRFFRRTTGYSGAWFMVRHLEF